jgi:small subunit ribosomal protein S20
VANIASAEKRNRQMQKRRARNRAAMSTLRTAIKRARTAVDDKAADAATIVKNAISTIDKAVSRGVLKKQTAARYVSRLSLRGREPESEAPAAQA